LICQTQKLVSTILYCAVLFQYLRHFSISRSSLVKTPDELASRIPSPRLPLPSQIFNNTNNSPLPPPSWPFQTTQSLRIRRDCLGLIGPSTPYQHSFSPSTALTIEPISIARQIAPETLSASGKVNRYVSTTHPLKSWLHPSGKSVHLQRRNTADICLSSAELLVLPVNLV
jgi:hypothetical protein